MRGWLGAITAMTLCMGMAKAAAPTSMDCGSSPTIACLSTEVFSTAKTLARDNSYRKHVEFAEQELAPGSTKVALQYVIEDNPDPSPWEDIDWISRAGRFDRAIELAGQRSSPVERLGGLTTVAQYMLESDRTRATRIVEDVERELRSRPLDDGDDYSWVVRTNAAEVLAGLGHTERAARLIGKSGVGSVSALLAIAVKYPAAANLRELAWQEAERAKEPYSFQLLVEDAVSRGDRSAILQAAQRASSGIEGRLEGNNAVSLAALLLKNGLKEQSARLVKPWPQWVRREQHQGNLINPLIPVLVGLGQDHDVRTAIDAVSDPGDRSQCLGRAAEEYLNLGRTDIAKTFDAEALRVALSSPTGDPKLQWRHDAALSNLALIRAGHGDVRGALDVADEIRDEAKVRESWFYIARRTIDTGHGPAAPPAILAIEQEGFAIGNAGLVLRAAKYWYEIGEQSEARKVVASAVEMTQRIKLPFSGDDADVAAELLWRINAEGKPEAMLEIVDKLEIRDATAIDRLVEIVRPVSPVAAIKLSGRQIEVERRIDELANIGIQIAETTK